MATQETFQKRLNDKVQFYAALATIIAGLLSLLALGIGKLADNVNLTGSFEIHFLPQLVQTSQNFPRIRQDYRNDSSTLHRINFYLKDTVPFKIYDFYSYEKKEYMQPDEKLQLKRADEKLSYLSNLLTNSYDRAYYNNVSYDRLPRQMTEILLQNQGDNTVKNISIDLEIFRNNQQRMGGYFQIDTLCSFGSDFIEKGPTEIKIDEIRPNKYKKIFVWSDNVMWDNLEGEPCLTMTFDGGSRKLYLTDKITSNGKLDRFFTSLVTRNTWIQIILYILTPMGLLYFFFQILPKIKSFILQLKQ